MRNAQASATRNGAVHVVVRQVQHDPRQPSQRHTGRRPARLLEIMRTRAPAGYSGADIAALLNTPINRVHGVVKLLVIDGLLVREGVDYHYWYHLPEHTGLQAPAHMRRSRANRAQAVQQHSAEQTQAARAASFARARAFAQAPQAARALPRNPPDPFTTQQTTTEATHRCNHSTYSSPR